LKRAPGIVADELSMRGTIVARTGRGVYDALFRPATFVGADHEALEASILGIVWQLSRLSVVFLVNLVAYAVPLTLAGFGTVPQSTPPAVFSALVAPALTNPTDAWLFVARFAQNGLYLTGAAVATFIAFHGGVLVTRSSSGVLASMHTVIYSTSAYLAGIFSFVMYLDARESFTRAAELVLWIQLRFVYAIIDAMGSDLVLQNAGRPGPVPPQDVSVGGQLLVAGLAVAGIYYVYSLYLGSRVNHDTSRTTALLTVAAVLSTPVLFVVGSVLAVTAVT
jgi:hypothetical protein